MNLPAETRAVLAGNPPQPPPRPNPPAKVPRAEQLRLAAAKIRAKLTPAERLRFAADLLRPE